MLSQIRVIHTIQRLDNNQNASVNLIQKACLICVYKKRPEKFTNVKCLHCVRRGVNYFRRPNVQIKEDDVGVRNVKNWQDRAIRN